MSLVWSFNWGSSRVWCCELLSLSHSLALLSLSLSLSYTSLFLLLSLTPSPTLTRSAALRRAELLLSMKHGLARLDNVWGVGGGQRPVMFIIGKVSKQ